MNIAPLSAKHKQLATLALTTFICLVLLILAYVPHLSAHQDQIFDVCLEVLKMGVNTYLKLLAQE